MPYTKGVAVTGFPFSLINKNSGDAVTTGTVTALITKDGGTQAALTGTPVHEGNGQWTINITAEEMDAATVGLLFFTNDSVPASFTIITTGPLGSTTTGTSVIGTKQIYGSLEGADLYFSQRLNTYDWDNATVDEKRRALIMATRTIDKLRYSGEKADPDQELEFPRDDDTTVPEAVEIAAYEIACSLLAGKDIEQEVNSLGVTSQKSSSTQTEFNTEYVPIHIRSGVLSIEAWNNLLQFFVDPQEVTLTRV